MNPSSHILEELLELDPTLGSDPAFSRVVETMVECKPKVKLREGFEEELKSEVLRHAELVSASPQFSGDPEMNSGGRTRWFLSWKTWSIFASGLAFASFAVFSAIQLDLFHGSQQSQFESTRLSKRLESTQDTLSEVSQKESLGGNAEVASEINLTLNDSDKIQPQPDAAAVLNISPVTQDKIIAKQKGDAPKLQGDPEPRMLAKVEPEPPVEITPETKEQAAPMVTSIPPASTDDLATGVSGGEGYGLMGDAPPPASMRAKVAVSSVKYFYTKDLPDFAPLQTVVTLRAGVETSQEITTKSPEVIKDDLVSGGYYAKDFAFDDTIRELKNPRIEVVIIKKNNEVYRVNTLVLDVVNSVVSGPKTVTVVLAEGF